MHNRERGKMKKTPGMGGIGIVVAILLLNAINFAAIGSDIFGIVIAILFIGIIGFSVAFALAKKNGKSGKNASLYSTERARESAMRYFTREDKAEEAIKCAHPGGREKYFHQLDNFLANGIIDKNEYRVLKARYEKANIPENMH